jgi:hypothetical protein
VRIETTPEAIAFLVNAGNADAVAYEFQRKQSVIEGLLRENADLNELVQRLRKAGDGLMFEGETMAHEVSWNPAPWDRVVAAWVAAKEGGRK